MTDHSFIHDDFLLTTTTARNLFHDIAKALPIIDYHCHIDPASLAGDHRFSDVAALWVASDPYKHRAMRINGVPEAEITGPADGQTKFRRWAETLERCVGNPLYHWSHLELARFFGFTDLLGGHNWQQAWDHCQKVVAQPNFNSRLLLTTVNAEKVVTSDLVNDNLSVHAKLASVSPEAWQVQPSLRGDDIVGVDKPEFGAFVRNLAPTSGHEVTSLGQFLVALDTRLAYFHAHHCRVADHSLDLLAFAPCQQSTAEGLFDQLLAGKSLEASAAVQLKSFLLLWLGQRYAERGWILALHLGAHRATSSRLRGLVGPAGGYAGIGNTVSVTALVGLLDALERAGGLPKTLLFTLNPADNAVLATLTGSFAQDGVVGKVQFGPAWWYNDHKKGMTEHLEMLSAHGLLERFVGMTTDSRSLLSLTRHEYFRRVFCDWVGTRVETGEFPQSEVLLKRLVEAVCYRNAKNWLNGKEME